MTPAQFLAKVARGDIPPVTLLLGSETYDRRRCREALIGAHLPNDEDREGGLAHYDLSEVSLAEVIDDARAMSLFAPRRVILATSAEAALPRTAKGGDEDEDSGGSGGGSGFETLAQYVKSPTPGTAIVFEACRFDFEGDDKKKNERIQKFYSAVREVVELRRYSAGEARGILLEMAKKAKLSLGPGVADTLSESLGGDAGRIATEIEKLATFAGPGKTLGIEDVAALIPDARETTIFVLVNALGRRDRLQALQVLDTLCRDGEYLPLALSFLSVQMRMALIAKESGLKTAGQIQGHFSKSGIPMWGSRAEQVSQTAIKFSKEQLERGMKLIFAADRDLRSARPDDRVVMENFVVALTAT
ncbi:MAG: polymerase delta subunit [Bryobacterales bacterium]|nr:polymerase delta subunit [Bryobacterales bacterium]